MSGSKLENPQAKQETRSLLERLEEGKDLDSQGFPR